jgi:hypothetical protein
MTKYFFVACLFIFTSCAEVELTPPDVKDPSIPQTPPKPAVYHCLLDNINEQDTLIIKEFSSGCFGEYKIVVHIFYRGDSLHATCKNPFPGNCKNRNYLNDSSIVLFRNFENEAREFKKGNGLCTTTSTCNIVVGEEKVNYVDKECKSEALEVFLQYTFRCIE